MTITIIAGHDPQKYTSWCHQILYGFSGHLLLASQDVEEVIEWLWAFFAKELNGYILGLLRTGLIF